MKFLYTLLALAILSTSISFAQTKKTSNKKVKKDSFIWGPEFWPKTNPKSYVGQSSSGEQVILCNRRYLKGFWSIMFFTQINYRYKTKLMYINNLKTSRIVSLNTNKIDGKRGLLDIGSYKKNYFLTIPMHSFKPYKFNIINWSGNYYAVCPGKAHANTYYWMKIDLDNPILTDPQEAVKLPVKVSSSQITATKTFFSPDSSYICFLITYKTSQSKNGFVSLAVYKKDMILKFQSDFEMPYNRRFTQLSDYNVNNLGQVFLVGKYYNNIVKNSGDAVEANNNFIFILKVTKKTKDHPIETKISRNSAILTDLNLTFNEDNNPNLFGFYKINGNKRGDGADGVFFAQLDNNNEVITFKKREFTNDFIYAKSTEKSTSKKTTSTSKSKSKSTASAPSSFKMSTVVKTSDSGYMALAYNYSTIVLVEYNSATKSRTYSYLHLYKDFMVFKFDANMKFKYWLHIDRTYYYIDSEEEVIEYKEPYKITENNGIIQIVYTDVSDKDKFSFLNGASYTVKVLKINSENGNFNRGMLASEKEQETFELRNENLFFTDSNNILTLAIKRNKLKDLFKKGYGYRIGIGQIVQEEQQEK